MRSAHTSPRPLCASTAIYGVASVKIEIDVAVAAVAFDLSLNGRRLYNGHAHQTNCLRSPAPPEERLIAVVYLRTLTK